MKRILDIFWFPITVVIAMVICVGFIRHDFGNTSLIYLVSLLACGWAIYELLSRIVHSWKSNKE